MNDCATTHQLHPKRLERSAEGRMIAGVASGCARFFDINVLLVRTLFVVLSFFSGLGVALYLAAWALIGEAGRPNTVSGEVLIRSWCK